MSGRKFEMHHYRQALLRMRQGDSDRDLARSRLMGRRSAAALRSLAEERGWRPALIRHRIEHRIRFLNLLQTTVSIKPRCPAQE